MVFLLNNFSVQSSCKSDIDANSRAIDQVLPQDDLDVSSNKLSVLNAVASLQVFFRDIYPEYKLCLVGEIESVRKDLHSTTCNDTDLGPISYPFIHIDSDRLEEFPLVQQLQLRELNRIVASPSRPYNRFNPSLGTHTMGLVNKSMQPRLRACGYGMKTDLGIIAYTGPVSQGTCKTARQRYKLLLSIKGSATHDTNVACDCGKIRNEPVDCQNCLNVMSAES